MYLWIRNLFSASEPRISKEIFMYYMRPKMNITKYDFKKLRTEVNNINCSNIILPYINFKTEGFKGLLDKLKNGELNIDAIDDSMDTATE